MPGTGVSTAAILTRRRAFSGLELKVHHRPSYEQFCLAQLERIERMQQQRVRRVRDARREGATRACNKAGCELALIVRGLTGSDAHPDDDAAVPLV